MKVLILGPKARYEAYMPEFVAQLPFETAYCSLDQSPQQAARENADPVHRPHRGRDGRTDGPDARSEADPIGGGGLQPD